tara:strand:+ start:930 stop:1037 length:108 start_codon:yes stop_codon:yes gene_type:complete
MITIRKKSKEDYFFYTSQLNDNLNNLQMKKFLIFI